jgi:hypothetical protein
VDSAVEIHATVPAGATTGKIAVSSADGTGLSGDDFSVTAPPVLSFHPSHDAHVYQGKATSNFGTLNTLRVKDDASDYQAYLKFDVAGIGTVQRATLRLFCTDASVDGGTVYRVSNDYASTATPWIETGLTWANAPTGGTQAAPFQAVAADAWVEFDVTSAISGNGTYSFALRSASTNSAFYDSKEGTNRPTLVIESFGGTPSPPSIASFTPPSGPVGAQVTVTGTHFVAITGVTFNGTSATTFMVDSPTQIRATVPAGATTGKIGVSSSFGAALSANDFVVTAPPPTVTFAPVQDAHAHAANATSNYGSLTTLRVKTDGTASFQGYLKFDVTGLAGPALSAKLQLFCTDDGPDGGTAYLVSNTYLGTATPWLESGLNWNNAPALGAPAGAAGGAATADAWHELDVTSAITGNGTYSFAIRSNSTNSVIYSSKEGANPPRLVVTAAPSQPAQALAENRSSEIRLEDPVPTRLTLQAHPNPSKGRVMFSYAAPRGGPLRLSIFDIRGRQVRSLARDLVHPGAGGLEWDGRDAQGRLLGPGVFVYRLQLGAERVSGKVVLSR